jgi:F-type H+-transporting ATPase subunit c
MAGGPSRFWRFCRSFHELAPASVGVGIGVGFSIRWPGHFRTPDHRDLVQAYFFLLLPSLSAWHTRTTKRTFPSDPRRRTGIMDPNQAAALTKDVAEVIKPVWHYMGAAIGFGITVLGAGLGIGKLAAAAAEGVARQPSAADKIPAAANLPLFLLEGATILALVFGLLLFLK